MSLDPFGGNGLPWQTGPTIKAVSSAIECPYCGKQVQPGQSITMTDGGWVHTQETQPAPEGLYLDMNIFEE